MTAVVVMAKECVAGRVKTRLTPPFTPRDAARIAGASLADTLGFAAALPVGRRVLAFEGRPPMAAGFDVIPQVRGSLDERIAAVLDLCDEPVLLIGMDTPQLCDEHVADALQGLASGRAAADAWLGPASDGGYWAIALREPRGELVRGVAMSRHDTGLRQRARLRRAGLRVAELPVLTDLDDEGALATVRGEVAPGSHLAGLFAAADAPRPIAVAGAGR